jgi:hypothetical protein
MIGLNPCVRERALLALAVARLLGGAAREKPGVPPTLGGE